LGTLEEEEGGKYILAQLCGKTKSRLTEKNATKERDWQHFLLGGLLASHYYQMGRGRHLCRDIYGGGDFT